MAERLARRPTELSLEPPKDVFDRLLQLQLTRPALKDKDHWIQSMAMTNFGAGVETTAITIGVLIDNLISHPECQQKVQAEIDQAQREGKLIPCSVPRIRDIQEHLPYLDACLKEGQRLHNVVGMPLPRVVPEGGVELEGHRLPAGVSLNSQFFMLNTYWFS